MKRGRFLLLMCGFFSLMGCGQTGRLYLPQKAVLIEPSQNNHSIAPHPPSNFNG